MKSEDFTAEELSQVTNPQPTQSVNPLAEMTKEVDNNDIGDNYWPIDDLPSKFKLYPEGTKIFARPLKVLEVKMLSSLNNDNFHHVITEVLKKSVRGINIDEDRKSVV